MLLLIYNTRFIRRKQKHTQEGPPGVVASSGGPCRVVRRRATLPHPVGCSTIAVPGLSFRVRNGTGRLSWAMAAANLGLSAGKRGFPPACGGSGTGQWTRCVLLLTDRARVRTVLPVRLRGACRVLRHTPSGRVDVGCLSTISTGRLHPRGASTSGLSTRVLHGVFSGSGPHGILILEKASRLDAFSGYPFRT